MKGRRKRAKKAQETGGWGWLVLAALALCLACRNAPPVAALWEGLQTFWQQLAAGDTLETLGRSLTAGAEEAVTVFGQQVLGLGK